jgi:HD-like signal output (HDOD) protein
MPAYTRDTLELDRRRISCAPRIIPKLAALVKDPNMNPEDVIEVIKHDPALTTRLIAACKSAAVNHGEDVATVVDAVNCLGFYKVYRIAVVIAFRSGFCCQFQAYEQSSDTIWQRAVATACFMEEFAEHEDDDLGVAYTIGLLHMIGMFLLDWHCSSIPGSRIPVRSLAKQIEAERLYCSITHMEVSALALDYWGFPEDVYGPIRWYATPGSAGPYATRALQLQLAVSLSHDVQNPLKAIFGAKTKASMNPGNLPLETIIPRVQKRLQAAIDFLRI